MAAFEPLLRAPPFPWADAGVNGPQGPVSGEALAPEAVFAAIREARIGGRFWADPAGLARAPERIERGKTGERVCVDGQGLGDVDPWSVLPGAGLLRAHGDDEWVALARVAGVLVEVLSPGRFGLPGEDGAALDARVAGALGRATWRDPFTGEQTGLLQTIALLGLWRTTLDANRSIAVACGMAWWKRPEIARFLWHPGRPLAFARRPARALAIARKAGGSLAVWPSRVSPQLIAEADAAGVPLVRVEDGFVRSVGLGVDLVPPSSVVVDASGIHFDPRGASDLETLLAHGDMPASLLARAAALRAAIVAAGISKYAADTGASVPERRAGKRLVLVPGQVEDDMSVRAGGGGLTSNLELVRRARALEPEAEIWFRPHPDVDAGHRKGKVPDAAILAHADRIVRGGGMAPLLDAVDAVHVLTSLTGFEALMRGREVVCHGTPFYAGWGLTRDLGPVPARRGRMLCLDALVAGVLICYPRYLDPVTGLPCPPEVLIARMVGARSDAASINRLAWVAPLRRWQGKLMKLFR